MSRYELWLTNTDGLRIESLTTVAAFSYSDTLGDVGAATVVLYGDGLFRTPRSDWRLEIWRHPFGGSLYLEFLGFVRDWERGTQAGEEVFIITAVSLNDLLRRKLVAYADGTAQASQTAAADNLMKEVVRDNLGTDATAARQLSNFAVEPNTSDGTSLSMVMAWKNVLTVLQNIQAASKADGNEVFFGIVPVTPTSFEFQTRTGQWGADRTNDAHGSLLFGTGFGNVADVSYKVVTSEEITRVYALGKGVGEERILTGVGDDVREEASPYNRREAFQHSQSETTATIQDEANRRLERGRPLQILAADILSTPQSPYGGVGGWHLGDRITVDHAGLQLDAIIRSVTVDVDQAGNERIAARAESVNDII